MGAVKAAPELVALGKDGRGEERFTSRDMIETEQRLERAAERMAGRSGHGLPAAALDRAIAAAGSGRSEEHTSELQSLMRISYAVFCLKKKKTAKPEKTQCKVK